MIDMKFPKPPSGKELIVLELLVVQREMYGLEMVHAHDQLKRGTVYVLLDRMEDKGFIKSRKVDDRTLPGMPRRLYHVTGLGQRALNAARQFQDFMAAGAVPTGGAT